MRDLKPEEFGHVYGAGGCGYDKKDKHDDKDSYEKKRKDSDKHHGNSSHEKKRKHSYS
jgi:hypothetical protein